MEIDELIALERGFWHAAGNRDAHAWVQQQTLKDDPDLGGAGAGDLGADRQPGRAGRA
jgi:hypothetical protein